MGNFACFDAYGRAREGFGGLAPLREASQEPAGNVEVVQIQGVAVLGFSSRGSERLSGWRPRKGVHRSAGRIPVFL